jgi:hypothetical protein
MALGRVEPLGSEWKPIYGRRGLSRAQWRPSEGARSKRWLQTGGFDRLRLQAIGIKG